MAELEPISRRTSPLSYGYLPTTLDPELLKKQERDRLQRHFYTDTLSTWNQSHKEKTLPQIDTIASALPPKPALKKNSTEIENFFGWLWSTLTKPFRSNPVENPTVESSPATKPEQVDGTIEIDRSQLDRLLREMNELLDHIKSSIEELEANEEEDRHKTELMIFKLMVMTVRAQQILKEQEVSLGKEFVVRHHKAIVEIRDKFFDLKKHIDENSNKQARLSFLSTVAIAAIFTTITAGLVMSAIATAGITAPAAVVMGIKTALFLVSSALSVASGGLQVVKAYISKKNGENKGEAFLLQHKRKQLNVGVKDLMKDIGEDINKDLQLVGMLRQILKNDQKAKIPKRK